MVRSHWALLGFKISYFSTTATSSYWWTVLSCSFCFLTFVLPQHGHVLSDIPDIPCQTMSIYGHVSWCFISHQVVEVKRGDYNWWKAAMSDACGTAMEQQQRKAALLWSISKPHSFRPDSEGDVMVMSWWCHDMISIYISKLFCVIFSFIFLIFP